MWFLFNYVSINKKNQYRVHHKWLCSLCISFANTNCKFLLGEWLERPTAVPRVSCSIPIVCKHFLISKFNISPVLHVILKL